MVVKCGRQPKGTKQNYFHLQGKVLRKIYGHMYNAETGHYERRTNADIERICNGPSILKISYLIKTGMGWAHIVR